MTIVPLSQEVQSRINNLGNGLAEFIASRPFKEAEVLMAELYDLINHHRDLKIIRAHKAIEEIMRQADFPSDKWTNAIVMINRSIKLLQGDGV